MSKYKKHSKKLEEIHKYIDEQGLSFGMVCASIIDMFAQESQEMLETIEKYEKIITLLKIGENHD